MKRESDIRFLYPPIFLLAFICWAIVINNKNLADYLPLGPSGKAVAISSNLLSTASILRSASYDLLSAFTNTPVFNASSNALQSPAITALTSNTALVAFNSSQFASNCAALLPELKPERKSEGVEIVSLIAAGGALVFVLGWAIGAITLSVVRLLFTVLSCVTNRKGPFDAFLPDGCIKTIHRYIGAEHSVTKDKFTPSLLALLSAATLDHHLLKNHAQGLHLWIQRRWGSCTAGVNSCAALLFSWVIVSAMGLRITCVWKSATMILFICFAFQAVASWREVMAMVEFQSLRELESLRDSEPKPEVDVVD